MLFPDERIGCDVVERVEVLGGERPELEEGAGEGGLRGEGHGGRELEQLSWKRAWMLFHLTHHLKPSELVDRLGAYYQFASVVCS